MVSKVGDVTLAPLDPEHGRRHLDAMMQAWQAGPQPAAAPGGEDRLRVDQGRPPGRRCGRRGAAARKAYEGDDYTPGRASTASAYLQRAYPDFAAMASRGEFARLAETLLRPLYLRHLRQGQAPRRTAGDAKA
jgi:exodeoxyribonuclease V gamma subunit